MKFCFICWIEKQFFDRFGETPTKSKEQKYT